MFFVISAASAQEILAPKEAAKLTLAIQKNDLKKVKKLVHPGNINDIIFVQGESGQAALGFAIANQRPKIAAWLLEAGADPNWFKGYITPLFSAALNRDFDLLQQLVAKGAKADLGRPSLTAAVTGPKDSPEIVTFLIKNGANPNARDTDESTPLMVAVSWGNLDAVKALSQAGADVNACEKHGKQCFSVLNSAVLAAGSAKSKGNGAEIVRYLLGKGASVALTNKQMNTKGYNILAETSPGGEIYLLLKQRLEEETAPAAQPIT